MTKRNSPLALLGDVRIQMERENKEEEDKLRNVSVSSDDNTDDDSPGSPGYINGLPKESMLKEQLDYSNEKLKQLKALYEERLKDGKNLDYKKQYEDKNKELLQMKSDYAEALSCLREETQSRGKV